MPIEVLMPALSPTMTEGNLAKWLVKEGDEVSSGDVIAEIETDKATMEVEAVDEGKMGKILVPEGTEGVPVNNIIALLLDEDEDAGALEGYEAQKPETGSQQSAEKPAENGAAAPEASGSNQPAPSDHRPSTTDQRIIASPLARRIAEQSGIDLSRLQGSGPHGRIIKADVENAPAGGASASVSAGPMPAMAGRNPQEAVEVPLNNMRKTIARRLLESKQQVPHFYLSMECEIDALMAARKQLNDAAAAAVASSEQKPAYKISVNDMVIKAVAASLRDVPEANAAWGGDKIIQYNNVDISVAVAIDGGLITPIIRNADQKSLSVISNEMKDLAARARDNKLAPEEFQGGGFSISNLGMYGVKQFNAIINPPQACILAVGAGEEKLVMRDGQPTAINIMTVTVSSDHRVVDGALGAIFLQAFKRYIENPMAMMV